MDREVTLMEILDAREMRAKRQQQLLARHTLPLVSFTLNIAGPVKTSAAIRRVFREGCARLDDALRGASIEVRAKHLFDAQYAARLLSRGDGTHAALVQFDREMIRRNLSPGGCADLLAMTYFLHFLQDTAAV